MKAAASTANHPALETGRVLYAFKSARLAGHIEKLKTSRLARASSNKLDQYQSYDNNDVSKARAELPVQGSDISLAQTNGETASSHLWRADSAATSELSLGPWLVDEFRRSSEFDVLSPSPSSRTPCKDGVDDDWEFDWPLERGLLTMLHASLPVSDPPGIPVQSVSQTTVQSVF